MDFQKLVKREVKQVLKTIGTLGKDITFVKKNIGEFDFATSTSAVTTNSTTVIRGIVAEKKINDVSKLNNNSLADLSKDTVVLSVIVDSDDINSFGKFDTVTIDGVTYTCTNFVKDNGYTTEAYVVRSL